MDISFISPLSGAGEAGVGDDEGLAPPSPLQLGLVLGHPQPFGV